MIFNKPLLIVFGGNNGQQVRQSRISMRAAVVSWATMGSHAYVHTSGMPVWLAACLPVPPVCTHVRVHVYIRT